MKTTSRHYTSKAICYIFVYVVCSLLLSGVTRMNAASTQDVTKTIYPNGFRLLVKPEPGRGLVALGVAIRSGALEEEDTPGIGQLLARTLFAGARNLSDRKLAQLSDDVGGSFSVVWDTDYTEVSIATTSDQMRASVELLAEILLHPKFTDNTVEKAKDDLTKTAAAGKESAFRSSYDELRRLLYKNSPYRRAFVVSPEVIKAYTAETLSDYASKWLVSSNMTLAVVGDVSVEDTQDAVKLWFGKQPAAATPERRNVSEETCVDSAPSTLEMDSVAAYVIAGSLASGMASPTFAADMVAVTVLGGGKSSRMFRDLREGQGLAYELGTVYPPLIYQSHALAYVLAAPYVISGVDRSERPAVDTVRAALKTTVDSLRSRPITQAELNRAKRYLTGSFALKHERLRERAEHLAWYEAMGLGYSFDDRFPQLINAVTLEAAQTSANRLFTHSAVVLVLPRE